MASRRGAVKFNPVTGKMEKMSEEERGMHRDGCLKLDEKYINAAKDLGLGAGDGMYSHIKSLVKVGGGDVPVGASIESEADVRARAAATAKPKATVDVTNTEAVKSVITTHVTAGGARIAGFGPTSASSGSGVHQHADAFQRRKGVVNTLGGARDVSRISKEEPAKLPPRVGDKPPGARIMTTTGLDAHAAEGKAKREAAEKKMRASSSGATARPGGAARGGAQIAGFTKTGGVAMISKPAGSITGGSGGGVAAARMAAAATAAAGGAGSSSTSSSSSGSHSARAYTGGGGMVGGPAATTRASSHGPSTSSTAATAAAPRHTASAAGGGGGDAGSGGDGMSDAERRAAFFRKQMADKAAKTAAASAFLKGDS